MNLGDLIASLEREVSGESALEALGEIVLLNEVRAMAEAFGEQLGTYVATSARRFAAGAGDEIWLSLIGAMERAEQPGQVAMRRMLRWALDDDARTLQGGQGAAPMSPACTCGRTHGCAG